MNKPTTETRLIAQWRVKDGHINDGIHNTFLDLNNYDGSLDDKEEWDEFVAGRIAEHFKHTVTWEIIEIVEVE